MRSVGGNDPIRSSDRGAIDMVREGMRVVDAQGRELGKVDSVKLPSTGQVTTQGSEYEGGLVGAFVADTGPDVPEPLRSRLMMSGYVEVDGPGLMDSDRYVPAGLIAGVSDDVVRLSAGSEEDVIPEMG